MRYPQDHNEQARRRLLERGGAHAKEHGFSGSGMDRLAAAAGVTTGSLYRHFAGKAEFFAAVVRFELRRTIEKYRAADEDPTVVATALAHYVSRHHVEHPGLGCPLPALTAEVARADESVRSAFQEGVLELHATFEKATGSSDDAWKLMAQNVGAVLLARAMRDGRARRDLLAAVGQATQALVEPRQRRGELRRRARSGLPASQHGQVKPPADRE
jgi:AcrR family transcriptional regulator